MNYRLWHPQLDVYDTIRRMLAILSSWTAEAPTRERLFISDFYLSSPPLLHLTRMTVSARRAFGQLQVPKPESQFLRYPAAPLLFDRMSGVQNEALANLVGRGLVDIELLEAGQVMLTQDGNLFAARIALGTAIATERPILTFLTTDFLQVGTDIGGLRSATGLRRIGL